MTEHYMCRFKWQGIIGMNGRTMYRCEWQGIICIGVNGRALHV